MTTNLLSKIDIPGETISNDGDKPINQQTTPNVDETLNTDLLGQQIDMHASGHEGFNPEIHASDENGMPKYKADGGFAKKRGRKVGGSLPGAQEVTNEKPILISPEQALEQSAVTCANLLFNVSVGVFGEEWAPSSEEAKMVKTGFKDYFKESGSPNIPPFWGLVIALLLYSLPRFSKPVTKSRLSLIKDKLVGGLGFFGRVKNKFHAFDKTSST